MNLFGTSLATGRMLARNILPQTAGVGIAVWFVAALFWPNELEAFFAGVLAGITVMAYGVYRPKMMLKRHAQEVEKELPFVLMALSVELNLGIPFEKALFDVAQVTPGAAGAQLSQAIHEIWHKGASVQEALQHMGQRVESTQVRRAVSQLVNAYERSRGLDRGEPIRRMAVELLSKQRSQAKAFSAKMTVMSLLFVVVSAIVPALFESFVIVGSLFLDWEWTPLQLMAISLIGFPLLDTLVLVYMESQTPVFLRREQ